MQKNVKHKCIYNTVLLSLSLSLSLSFSLYLCLSVSLSLSLYIYIYIFHFLSFALCVCVCECGNVRKLRYIIHFLSSEHTSVRFHCNMQAGSIKYRYSYFYFAAWAPNNTPKSDSFIGENIDINTHQIYFSVWEVFQFFFIYKTAGVLFSRNLKRRAIHNHEESSRHIR